MIKLKETGRQILAGIIASAAFAATYIIFALRWDIALGIAVAVYIAVILLVERAPEDKEIYLYENLTQQDLDAAVAICRSTAKKLQAISKIKTVDTEMSLTLQQLAQLIQHISKNYQEDPRDLKHSRAFVNHYLPRLNTISDDFKRLSSKALTPKARDRLDNIAQQIEQYVPHFQAIYDACLENDFKKLELETSVLGDVMKFKYR